MYMYLQLMIYFTKNCCSKRAQNCILYWHSYN